MTDPAPDACEVCGASPVELVLYPVAIHYKGSGFYSTDYAKGEKKKEAAAAGSSDGASSSEKSEKKTEPTKPAEPKKAAEPS
jgi:predicted nucleic acid-binding Zn ribbon protein